MSGIRRRWTAAEADLWTKEDYLTFILSPLVYVLFMIGTALSLFLLWYGFLLLGAGVVLMLVMLWIIDPKLKAISEDYEAKQKQYLEDLEKIARWED
jgi:ABC-type transport system involved in cytochrome bd biosynthesis fused ATPase/permease subunit